MNSWAGDGVFSSPLIVLHAVTAVATASHALLHKRDPRSAWGWIATCWLLPFIGAFLYYLFGVNRIQHKAIRLLGPPPLLGTVNLPVVPHSVSETEPNELRELVRIGAAMSARPLSNGNRITVLHNGDAAYPAMLKAISEARHTVYLCSYIFESGTVADRFITALAAARVRGVRVRVLIDGWTDVMIAGAGYKQLVAAGVTTARFLPLRLWPPRINLNLRNHRKLLLIDGRSGFCGGMNIRDAHQLLPQRSDTISDMQFLFDGPVTGQLEECFCNDWVFATGETLNPSPHAAVNGDAVCRTLTDGPNEDLDKLTLVLLAAIAAAHYRVWLMTPYFIPGEVLIAALQSAALRGVDVSIVLPARSDQRYVDWAARRPLEYLLTYKVCVWQQAAPFAHTKIFLVDDHYAQVGSANMDRRSLRLNFELNVEVYNAAFVALLAAHFAAVRSGASPLTIAKLEARQLPERLRDAVCWLFSPYL